MNMKRFVKKSFEKTIALVITLAMVMSLFVFKADAYAADDYLVDKVEINFDEPKEGDDIAAFLAKKGNAKVPSGAHYKITNVYVKTGEWPYETILKNGKFENKDYFIVFNITFDSGYRNTSDIMNNGLIINGFIADYSSYTSGNILDEVGMVLSFGKPLVNSINCVVPEPDVGKTPAKYVDIESDPADATIGKAVIAWFKGTEDYTVYEAPYHMDDDLVEMKDDEVCEEGMYYYAFFFAEGSDFAINPKYQNRVKEGHFFVNGKIYEGPGFCYVVKYGPLKYKYNVSFETGEGSKVATQRITEGEKATKPADPTRSGYTFAGWYTSNDYKTPFDFGKSIMSDTVVYAKWEKEEPKYKNEWVDGKWYDEFGNVSYNGILSWKQDATGWWVEDTNGWYPQSKWQKIDGKWYYFCADGYMDYSEYRDGCWLGADGAWDEAYSGGHWMSDATGWWYEDNSGWYPVSRWLWIDGSCYYFESSGYIATNKYVDGCWLGADGAWVK